MTSNTPPSIPPRPLRAKSPQPGSPASATSAPAIPSRPPRPGSRAKSPSPDNALQAVPLEASHHEERPEPAPTTIPSYTELHAPVARSTRPAPIPKTDSEFLSPGSMPNTPSIYKEDFSDREREGIPQIGRRVPMYPNAGDVQAPTPTETPNSGRKKHVYREEWEMNEGAYGGKRRETPYSMSSKDLNAVVSHSGTPGVGINDEETHGVPDEELGYIASEQYSRTLSRSHSPVHTRDSTKVSPDCSTLGEKTDEHGNVIHLEDPSHGSGYLRRGNSDQVSSCAESHHGGEDLDDERDEYSILAEDEILKRKQGQYMQAAVYTPSYNARHTPRSRPQSSLKDHEDVEKTPIELLTSGTDSHRTSYEELSPADGNAKPLFPESDDEGKDEKDSAAENKKRPGYVEHRFPSKDVWEEAPEHAQLEATVETPPPGYQAAVIEEDEVEIPHRQRCSNNGPDLQYVKGQPHEHYQPGDEQEYERKQKEGAMKDTDYRVDLKDLPDDERLQRLKKQTEDEEPSEQSSHRRNATRRKFPSNDIWEDVPPSLDLQEEIEPENERPTTQDVNIVSDTLERHATSAAPLGSSSLSQLISMRPNIPTRPQRERKEPPSTIHEQPDTPPSEKKAIPPAIPGKPKPSIPIRPIRPSGLVRTASEEKQQPPEPKPKPAIPPRTGGKIAALKAGFLGDLESRLKMGPSAPKREEKEEEEEDETTAKPEVQLSDVRKSRARGPRGRKLPTKEEQPSTRAVVPPKSEITGVWTVFTLDQDLDAVIVNTMCAESSELKEDGSPNLKNNEETVGLEESKSEMTKTTAFFSGVSGTGEQADLVAVKDSSSPDPESASDSQPTTVTEETNPTAVLTCQHPEDAIQ